MAKTRNAGKLIARAIRKGFKKRYYRKGALSSTRILRDVNMLKSMVNAEKKYFDISARNQTVGQLDGTTAGGGYYIADVTPIPAQGDTDVTRDGDSIKICSAYIRFQLWEQTSMNSPTRIKIELYEVVGQPQTVNSTMVDRLLQTDNMITGTTIYDYNSPRGIDHYKNYRLIKRSIVTLNENFSSQVSVKEKIIKLKFKNRHIKFEGNGTTLANGQIVCLITADIGNKSASVTGTATGAIVTATNTGANLNYTMRWYYFDN